MNGPSSGPRTRATRGIATLATLTLCWIVAQVAEPVLVAALSIPIGIGVAAAASHPRRRAARAVQLATAVGLVLATAAALVWVGGTSPTIGWFGGGSTHGSTGHGWVALTFDDGPHPSATLEIASELERAHVRGTFFEIGRAVDAHPAITRELERRGHLLGNHSYSHGTWQWLDPTYPDVDRGQAAFARAGVACPVYFRPPRGRRTPLVARAVSASGLQMVLWDDSGSDWSETDPHRVARSILRKVHDGSIVLLHDGLNGDDRADRSVVVAALPEILDGLAARGLRAVRLDELLGGPATQACRTPGSTPVTP